MSSSIYVRLGGWDLLQEEAFEYQYSSEYLSLLFDINTEKTEKNVPEYGLLDPEGNIKFMFPYENRFNEKKGYIANLIGFFNLFCEETDRYRVTKLETLCEETDQENVTTLKEKVTKLSYTEHGFVKWITKQKEGTESEDFTNELRVCEYGLYKNEGCFELLTFISDDYIKKKEKELKKGYEADKDIDVKGLVTTHIGAFNRFSIGIDNGMITKFETTDKNGLKKKTKLKTIGDDYIFWVTYTGSDSLIDYLCDLSEDCILNDHSEILYKFGKNGCLANTSEMKEDLMFLFRDYIVKYKAHLEIQPFNNHYELEAVIN